MSEEYKKYDSQASITAHNVRLAKEPQIIEGGEKPMVKLTVVLTSRSDRHSDAWWELTVQDRQADMASFLQKGDAFGFTGFPAVRKWGDDNKNTSLEAVRVEIFPAIELMVKLKERGWTPGAPRSGGKKSAPAAKKTTTKKPRPVQDLDEDLPADEG